MKLLNMPAEITIDRGRVNNIVLAGVFCALFLLGFIIYQSFSDLKEQFVKPSYLVRGIDISHHNTVLNWGALLEQNISFSYLKASEGLDHLDRDYGLNYQLVKNTSMRVGAYHFYSFGVSGKGQARHFISTVNLESGDLIPAIDVEYSPSNMASADSSYVASVILELKNMSDELYKHYGVYPLIYTNKECYERYVKDRFSNPIWMSDLNDEPSEDINWFIWQYSHTGSLRGIKGDIDLNYFRHDFASLNKMTLP